MNEALISTNDTVYIGEKTLEKLFDQQQTINNIEKNINNIENNINISDIIIEKMEYLTNRIKSWIFYAKINNFEDIKKKVKYKYSNSNNTNQNFNQTNNTKNKINFNTNQIINNLEIIKEINININTELDNQIQKLDNIGNNIENNNTNINKLNNRINKIL